jgi:hypothetical protein
MRFITLLFIVAFSFAGYAQFDTGNNSFSIPPAQMPAPVIKEPTKSSANSPFPSSVFDPMPKSSGTIPEKSNFKFLQTNDFINPGDEYVEKLNKNSGGDGGDYTLFRKNQYLGDFKTSSKKVTISYRDHQAVDGDEIRIWVNDRIVQSRVGLDSSAQGFELDLEPGFNKIDFEAMNQGASGPNTAEFRIYDENGGVISSNRWDLATGFKATIIVVKQ